MENGEKLREMQNGNKFFTFRTLFSFSIFRFFIFLSYLCTAKQAG